MKTLNAWELKPNEIDFPLGEPVLKQKRGLFYRPNNNGYTNELIEAGLYEREEAINYCFDQNGKNGYCDVLAIPIRVAIERNNYCRDRIAKQRAQLDIIEKYVTEDKIPTVVF